MSCTSLQRSKQVLIKNDLVDLNLNYKLGDRPRIQTYINLVTAKAKTFGVDMGPLFRFNTNKAFISESKFDKERFGNVTTKLIPNMEAFEALDRSPSYQSYLNSQQTNSNYSKNLPDLNSPKEEKKENKIKPDDLPDLEINC